MSGAVAGDFAGLDKAIREATGYADGTKVRRAMGAVTRELSAVIRQSFDSARTPEGERWKPLKSRRGRPLNRTGRLRATAVRPILVGLTVRFGLTTYGGWQNDGTRTIPARAFLPAVPLASELTERLRSVALQALSS